MNDDSIQSMGGKARAEALTDEQRTSIASTAAAARWGIQKATHTGELKIGNATIRCAVLEDGRRVLTQFDVLRAIGRSGKPAAGRGTADLDPLEKGSPLLDSENLKPFVPSDLSSSIMPVKFILPTGQRAWGYNAEILPRICEVYLSARAADVLRENQKKFAAACELLVRGLARIGIIALVDEATGYQEIRNREALQAILDAFLRQEFAAWAKRFPDEFYKEMFRLRGWEWKRVSVRRPVLVGKLTNDVVYERLAPGVLAELENRNPKDDKGRRQKRHHQWLTDDIGHPALAQHLHAVIGFMRASADWKQFHALLDRSFPKKGEVIQLELIQD
jgi:hypothetical protein